MIAIANFVMRGRIQAILATTLFAAFSFWLAPLSIVSAAIICLLTLRLGPYNGFVALASATAILALSFVALPIGESELALVFACVVWLPMWVLAIVLRQTVSLPTTLYVAGAITLLIPLMFHVALGDPIVWWTEILTEFLPDAFGETEILAAAKLMTGIIAALFLLSLMFSLFLGRWWQARLYNPEGFYEEFINLRFHKVISGVALGLMLLTIIAQHSGLIADITFVFLTLCCVPGVALIHSWVHHTKANKAWLIALYLVLFVLSRPAIFLLAIITISDAWLNYRRYYLKQ